MVKKNWIILTLYLVISIHFCDAVSDYYTVFENTVIENVEPVLETNTTSALECQLSSQRPTRFTINVIKKNENLYLCRVYTNKKTPKNDHHNFEENLNSTVYILHKPEPTNCQDWKALEYDKDGTYEILIDQKSVKVFCDMTNFDGGWIVIQKRFNNSVDFNRDWEEYKNGFGRIDGGEFWLGNEFLHKLTWEKSVQIILEAEDQDGVIKYGRYRHFSVSSEIYFYRLGLDLEFMDGLSGFDEHSKGMLFSTRDLDKDQWKDGYCATRHGGGWWYYACGSFFFNGINDPLVEFYGIRWKAWDTFKYKVRTKMMIKAV